MPKQLMIRYWAIYYFIRSVQSVHFWDVYVRIRTVRTLAFQRTSHRDFIIKTHKIWICYKTTN